MQLTPHFTLEEFTKSQIATARGINNNLYPENKIDAQIVANLRNLCEKVLEPLRVHFGEPIPINSGYRCPALNRAVKGSGRSFHMTGRAADIPFREDWYRFIRHHLPYTELINEGAWIHVAL